MRECFAQLFAVNPQEPQIRSISKSLWKKILTPLGTCGAQLRLDRASQVLLANHLKQATASNFYENV